MFQIAFGLGSDSERSIWYHDIPRMLVSLLDQVVYLLLKYVYAIFFNIANSEVISSKTIAAFYGRVQLILGVVMIFKLSVSLLQVIINPELLTDQKQGFGKIISRILIMLLMFAAIVPLNIKGSIEKNSYNYFLNKNGILFGTMYSLQYRVLQNNTIARLILGTEEAASFTGGSESDQSKKENSQLKAGDKLGAYILKVFIRPNSQCKNASKYDGDDAEYYQENYYDKYENDVSISFLLNHINTNCALDGDDRYVFAYFPIISTISGLFILICLFAFCIDIAIRAIKLAVLRLIAPIPIISYIDPKSSEKGAFGNWVKMVTTTYLDIFIRLAIIYFVLFLAEKILFEDGLDISVSNPIISGFTTVFIIIGLFNFARVAPKFFRDALGLKGTMGNVGLSGILGGAAALVGGAGLKGAAAAGLSSMQNANMAEAQGKQAPPAWSAGRDLAAQIRTGDPKAKGGIINSLNDHLMRDAGINVARKVYGVTAQGLKDAQDKMYADQDAAAAEKDLYDRFVRGNASEDEMRAWAEKNNSVYDSARGTMTDSNGVVKTARQAIYDNANALKVKAGKSQKDYEDAKKFGDSHRVTPSFEEEHRASWRERYHSRSRANRIADRPDMFNSRGEGATAHQRGMDRVMGSRDDWTDVNSPRVDNRWAPGTVRNTDENAIHDNPDLNIDTPEAGSRPR